MERPTIHTVSFASEGPPHDEGLPLGWDMLNSWGAMCIAGGSTTFTGHTVRSLSNKSDGDAWCVQSYPEEHFMSSNPGYHKTGLGAWRAVILRKAMDTAKDGDIVVVHCVNFKKYPNMCYFAENLRPYAEAVVKFTDLYSPPHEWNAYATGAEVLALISDPEVRRIVAFAPAGLCRLIIARVNSKTRAFAKTFEETIKSDPILLSPKNKTVFPGSAWHHEAAEQAVFNVLAYREGLFPLNWQTSWMSYMKDIAREHGCGVDKILRLSADSVIPQIQNKCKKEDPSTQDC